VVCPASCIVDILDRGTSEEVGRAPRQAPLVVVDKVGMEPLGLGPDMLEGSLGSSGTCKGHVSSPRGGWLLVTSGQEKTTRPHSRSCYLSG
jgi:hypothetical protein